MSNHSSQNNNYKNTVFLIFSFGLILAPVICTDLFAANKDGSSKVAAANKELSELQRQARIYRVQGLQQQDMGNLDAAMSFYQKAIELDPSYSVAYNDLGIIYEAKGMADRAEDSYQKAVTVDPIYLSSYSNLAALYEAKGDLNKAASYWKKRVELGLPNDKWTQKAKERFDALMRLSPAFKQEVLKQQVLDLDKKVAELKKFKKQEDLKKAKEHVGSARKLYNGAEYNKAMHEVKLALFLDPQEKEALGLRDKIKAKQAEQEKKEKEEKKKRNMQEMKARFESGLKFYQQDNLQAAKEEFTKIKELVAPPLKK